MVKNDLRFGSVIVTTERNPLDCFSWLVVDYKILYLVERIYKYGISMMRLPHLG